MTRRLSEVPELTPPTVEINDAIFHQYVNGSPQVAVKELERQVNRALRQLTDDLNNAFQQISEQISKQTDIRDRRNSGRSEGTV